MRVTLITLFLFAYIAGHSQFDSNTVNFISKIIDRTNDTSIIGYTRTLGSDYYNYVEVYAYKKKLWDLAQKNYVFKLSRKDRRSIRKQILSYKELEWPANLLNNSELIPKGEGDNYYIKYPTREIYQFTIPVFIRNNTIALVMIKKHFPRNVGGYEEISIYKLSPDGWVRLGLLQRSDWGNTN